MTDWPIVSLLAFGLSFLFALGGVGSAIALVPALSWLGMPLAAAKPTGLLVNTLSMTGASVTNLRAGLLDFRLGAPLIVTSLLFAPLGAWSSQWLPIRLVLMVFVLFLAFSGGMLLLYRGGANTDHYREDRPLLLPAVIGALAGFLSGLLGVGGGGLIAPLMIMQRFNPKKVAVLTAFVVPFSSATGFLAYMTMGDIQLERIMVPAVAAFLGGSLGTYVMHRHLQPQRVKKVLGVLLVLMALKMLAQLFA